MNIDSRDLESMAYDAATAEAAERLRFSVGFALSGLQALTLANGGALIALFTFLGNSGAVTLFAVGLASNLVAFIGAHLSQDAYYTMAQVEAWKAQAAMAATEYPDDVLKHHRTGTFWQRLAMIAALLALACFICGAAFALAGVTPR